MAACSIPSGANAQTILMDELAHYLAMTEYDAKTLSSTRLRNCPATSHLIQLSFNIPVGSNPALPPGKLKPWRSPAPCAATKSAAGKTMSNSGGRGSILGRWVMLSPRVVQLFPTTDGRNGSGTCLGGT